MPLINKILKTIKILHTQIRLLYQLENPNYFRIIIEGFELDSRNMLLDTVKDAGIIKDGVYATYVTVVTNLQDEMIDMMDISNEIQEAIGRSKNMPHDIDEDELLGALALAGENSESVNPLITRIRNGLVGSFHDKMNASLDPIKELSRFVYEHKYKEPFIADVWIVSWL
ncbi:enhancer of mRNA-decapping protein 4-like protein [Tanacetum coccineum]